MSIRDSSGNCWPITSGDGIGNPVLENIATLPMTTIHSILDEIERLKPISDIAGKVLALVDDPDCGMSDLADIIHHEPALTANLLKLANSAYFGLPGKIADAKQAIVYLGMNQVIDLVLLVSCSQTLSGAQAGYGLARGELWKGAVSGAILAGDMAEKKGLKHTGLAFTGGLLRDIGKVVIDQYVKSASEQIADRIKSQNISFFAAERQVLGVDHAQVGAMLAEKWLLPSPLTCIIRYCHAPLEADGCFVEVAVVYLADCICRRLGIARGIDDDTYPEDERIAKSLGLSEAAINDVIDRFNAKLARVDALFSSI
jgi:HD-like signal output (HDOD) protein